jgi:hypothetical protein
VNQAAGVGAGPRAKIVLLDKNGPETPHGGVPGNPGAGDPAANNQEIRGVGYQLGQSRPL